MEELQGIVNKIFSEKVTFACVVAVIFIKDLIKRKHEQIKLTKATKKVNKNPSELSESKVVSNSHTQHNDEEQKILLSTVSKDSNSEDDKQTEFKSNNNSKDINTNQTNKYEEPKFNESHSENIKQTSNTKKLIPIPNCIDLNSQLVLKYHDNDETKIDDNEKKINKDDQAHDKEQPKVITENKIIPVTNTIKRKPRSSNKDFDFEDDTLKWEEEHEGHNNENNKDNSNNIYFNDKYQEINDNYHNNPQNNLKSEEKDPLKLIPSTSKMVENISNENRLQIKNKSVQTQSQEDTLDTTSELSKIEKSTNNKKSNINLKLRTMRFHAKCSKELKRDYNGICKNMKTYLNFKEKTTTMYSYTPQNDPFSKSDLSGEENSEENMFYDLKGTSLTDVCGALEFKECNMRSKILKDVENKTNMKKSRLPTIYENNEEHCLANKSNNKRNKGIPKAIDNFSVNKGRKQNTVNTQTKKENNSYKNLKKENFLINKSYYKIAGGNNTEQDARTRVITDENCTGDLGTGSRTEKIEETRDMSHHNLKMETRLTKKSQSLKNISEINDKIKTKNELKPKKSVTKSIGSIDKSTHNENYEFENITISSKEDNASDTNNEKIEESTLQEIELELGNESIIKCLEDDNEILKLEVSYVLSN